MKSKIKNPFYALLVLVGVAFVVTASAYGVMTVRGTDRSLPESPQTGILGFMDRYGNWVLTVEVVLLGVLTVAAMGTDQLETPQINRNANEGSEECLSTSKTNHSQKGTET
ncbi:MAG: hypothetical protein P8K78_00265 [Pirellulales bacterium]|nr:hypothetical protein [Pirellulales bacterium]